MWIIHHQCSIMPQISLLLAKCTMPGYFKYWKGAEIYRGQIVIFMILASWAHDLNVVAFLHSPGYPEFDYSLGMNPTRCYCKLLLHHTSLSSECSKGQLLTISILLYEMKMSLNMEPERCHVIHKTRITDIERLSRSHTARHSRRQSIVSGLTFHSQSTTKCDECRSGVLKI